MCEIENKANNRIKIWNENTSRANYLFLSAFDIYFVFVNILSCDIEMIIIYKNFVSFKIFMKKCKVKYIIKASNLLIFLVVLDII